MSKEVAVITHALRVEAKMWNDLCNHMVSASNAADDLTLSPSAFMIGDFNVSMYSRAYDSFHESMTTILRGAAIEFEQMAQALRKAADIYDRHNEIVELSLDDLFTA